MKIQTVQLSFQILRSGDMNQENGLFGHAAIVIENNELRKQVEPDPYQTVKDMQIT